MQIGFKTIAFELKGDYLEITLLNIFKSKIPLNELEEIGKFKLKDSHTIEFLQTHDKKTELCFLGLLSKAMDNLTNSINGNPAVYIHRNSEIPLIGNVSFGIVYRNSSLIEIKPVTSCNLNCIYCSVGEGQKSEKVDYVIEKDYLIEELQKLIDFVAEPVEVHIGVQGEPFLYADLMELIEDLQNNKQIKVISMDTNMTLTTSNMLDRLSKCNKLRLNISLDALNPDLAQKMAGCVYNLEHVLKMIKYAVSKKIKILIAPVLLPGHNEEEMEKIIGFIKELKLESKEKHPIIGIQNFLNYKTGRNPAKAKTWEEFYEFIRKLEQKTEMDLKLNSEKFGIRKTKELPKPFREGDEVKAIIKLPDRFPHTSIAVAKDRCISIPDCEFRRDKTVKVKITRDKHNIFGGKLVK